MTSGFFDQAIDEPKIPDAPTGRSVLQGNRSRIPAEVQRDGYGRPLLYPDQPPLVRVPYTRASSLADYVSDQRAVHTWESRYLARGYGMRPDLARLASMETYNTGFSMTDKTANAASGRRLDKLNERALDTVQIHEKADYGTAVHWLTEPENREAYVADDMKGDVDSWWAAVRGIEILATEVFVANDELMAAGTFDHLVRVPGIDGLIVLDKKTGKLSPSEFAVQLTVYARGQVYDVATDVRTPLEAVAGTGEVVRDDIGIIAHIPAFSERTVLYPIDLTQGYEAALHAIWVREYHANNSLLGDPMDLAELARAQAMKKMRRVDAHGSETEMRDGLVAVHREYLDVWSQELTDYGNLLIKKARKNW